MTRATKKKTNSQSLKKALVDALHEERELLREALTEVLEDFAMSAAIEEGRTTKPATRTEIQRLLRGRK
jgi:hypothetical protein